MAGLWSCIGCLAVVLLGAVGSFATLAQQSSALQRCRIGLRLRETLGRGEKRFAFFFPEWKVEVDDKEASDRAPA